MYCDRDTPFLMRTLALAATLALLYCEATIQEIPKSVVSGIMVKAPGMFLTIAIRFPDPALLQSDDKPWDIIMF